MLKYMAKQPIFNKNNKIFGYELLYRNSESNMYPENVSSYKATKELINNYFIEFDGENSLNSKPVFINFPKESLMSNLIFLLNPKNVIIEILETVHIDQELIDRLGFLKKQGYIFAIDDYIGLAKFDALLEFVDYVKVDLSLTTREIWQTISKKLSHKILLGEKIEEEKDFLFLKKTGYSLFQGYYFSKPQIMKTQGLDMSMATYRKLLSITQEKNCDFNKLADIIKQDVAMVNKLLKKVNTMNYSPCGRKISSIIHALMILGLDKIQRWIAIIMLQSVANTESEHIIYTALLRASFCEKLANIMYTDKNLHDCAYYNGMFSVFENNTDFEIIFGDYFNLKRKNEVSNILYLSICYTEGNWAEIIKYQEELKLNFDDIAKVYYDALKYADNTLNYQL